MEGSRAIGIDLGGTKILAGVVADDGTIVRSVERPTPLDSQDAIMSALEAAVEELLGDDVCAVGLGVPLILDPVTRVAFHATNLPVESLDIAGRISRRFGLPAAIDNDGNAATLAEWRFGAARGARDVVMLTLGTGVGGGLILAGRLYSGWAEIGHVVVDADGPPCQGTCHGRGHLEVLVSGTAADAAAERLYGPDADARTLVERGREGRPEAVAELARMGHLLGVAVGSFVNLFFPDVVVVGGGFGMAAGELMLGPARAAARREAVHPGDERIRIVPAALGETAGLIGAGLLGLAAVDVP
jgi:glucokinase